MVLNVRYCSLRSMIIDWCSRSSSMILWRRIWHSKRILTWPRQKWIESLWGFDSYKKNSSTSDGVTVYSSHVKPPVGASWTLALLTKGVDTYRNADNLGALSNAKTWIIRFWGTWLVSTWCAATIASRSNKFANTGRLGQPHLTVNPTRRFRVYLNPVTALFLLFYVLLLLPNNLGASSDWSSRVKPECVVIILLARSWNRSKLFWNDVMPQEKL